MARVAPDIRGADERGISPGRLQLGEPEFGGQDIRLTQCVVDGTRRVDHDVGARESLFVGGLSVDPTSRVFLRTRSQPDQAVDAHVSRRVRHHDEVEWMRDLSLDEQGHIVDHDSVHVALLRLSDQLARALPYGRMHDGVQVGEGLAIGKHDRTQRGSVESAIGADDIAAESRSDRVECGCARLDHLAREKIGVDVDGTALFEATCNGRFSGRDSAREPDEFHSPSVALRQRAAANSCK